MRRRPRDPGEPLLSRRQLTLGFFQGFSVLVAVIAVFATALYRGQPARALTFVTLVIAYLTLILANRSWSRIIVATLRGPNPALWWVVGGTIAVLVLSIYVPFLRSLFRFSALDFVDIAISFAAGGASLLWFEAWKLFRKSSGEPQPT
jgi:Ca2+-transporting ATPase